MDKFSFKIVEDAKMLEDVFAFRYKILSEIYPEYIKSSQCVAHQEYDKYDEYAIQYVIVNQRDEMCATVRLIHHSPLGYPTENSLTFDKSQFQKEHLGEISRIFVNKDYRNFQTTKAIIEVVKKMMYDRMKELDIYYSYGSLEKNFLRLLHMYKMPYEPLAKPQEHGLFGVRYPCILYTNKLGAANGYD